MAEKTKKIEFETNEPLTKTEENSIIHINATI